MVCLNTRCVRKVLRLGLLYALWLSYQKSDCIIVLCNIFAAYSCYHSPDSFIILFVVLVLKQHLQWLCHSHEFGSKNQFEVFGKTEENANEITNASGGLQRSSHVSCTCFWVALEIQGRWKGCEGQTKIWKTFLFKNWWKCGSGETGSVRGPTKTSECEILAWKWCPNCFWMTIESTKDAGLQGHAPKHREWPETSHQSHYGRWNLGVWIHIQTPKLCL